MFTKFISNYARIKIVVNLLLKIFFQNGSRDASKQRNMNPLQFVYKFQLHDFKQQNRKHLCDDGEWRR